MVRSHFRSASWDEIKQKIKVRTEAFVSMGSYLDEATYPFVGAASEILELSPADVMHIGFNLRPRKAIGKS